LKNLPLVKMKNRILALSLIPLAAMTMSACDIQRISTPNPTPIILFTAVPTPTLSPQDYYYNGELFYTQGDYELAILAYDATLRLDPDFAYVYFRRGQAYANIENYYAAIDNFTKALELIPNYVVAYNNRGMAYQRMGNDLSALSDFNKAIELDPEYPPPYYQRGLIYQLNGQNELAVADYLRYLEVETDSNSRLFAEERLKELGAWED